MSFYFSEKAYGSDLMVVWISFPNNFYTWTPTFAKLPETHKDPELSFFYSYMSVLDAKQSYGFPSQNFQICKVAH